jgi:hypothetical protein
MREMMIERVDGDNAYSSSCYSNEIVEGVCEGARREIQLTLSLLPPTLITLPLLLRERCAIDEKMLRSCCAIDE